MTNKTVLLFIFSFSFLGTGCATVFKGYYDEVPVDNYAEGTTISDRYGAPVQIEAKNIIKTNRSGNPYESRTLHSDSIGTYYVALLRTSEQQVLTIHKGTSQKVVVPNRKVGIGWLMIDTALLIYPMVIDAYTGAWHQYERIDAALP